MEHLFFKPTKAELDTRVESILASEVLDCDWMTIPNLGWEPTWPVYTWLGFDHERYAVSNPPGSFADYGRVRGWNVELITPESALWGIHADLQGQSGETALDLIAAFLQSWFFVGLLECTLAKRMTLDCVTRLDPDGQRRIDTRYLTFVFYAEVRRVEKMSLPEKRQMLNGILGVLSEYERMRWNLHQRAEAYVAQHNTNRASDKRSYPEDMAEIHNLSALACDIIFHVYRRSCGLLLIDKTLLWGGSLKFKDCLRPSVRRLLSAGFCKSFLDEITDFNHSTMEWVAWWGKHTGIPNLENHDDCTEQQCKLQHLRDMAAIHTGTCDYDDCRKIAPPLEVVLTALEFGRVPLICLVKERENDEIIINVSVFDIEELQAADYVAISHVWRHGRGGTTEGGILQCQLRAVWASVFNTHLAISPHSNYQRPETTPLFWMDSLCVPSSVEHRKKAIQNINRIFSSCERVLVLDEALRSMKMAGHSTEGTLAGVLTSAWQSRLWTFLEAYTTPTLLLDMDDYQIKMRIANVHTFGGYGTANFAPDHLDIVRSKLDYHVSLRGTRAEAKGQAQFGTDKATAASYFQILQAVRNRSTTRNDDESIILANIFEIDTKPLARLEGEQRMRALYEGLKYFPAHWLFLRLPKLSIPNSGWAPKTLRLKDSIGGVPHPTADWKDEYGEVTPEGLVCTFPIIKMHQIYPLPINDPLLEYTSSDFEGRHYCSIGPSIMQETVKEGPEKFKCTCWVKDSGWDAILIDTNVSNGTFANALLLRTLPEVDDLIESTTTCRSRVVATVMMLFKPREWFESFSTPHPLIVSHTGRYTAAETLTLV